MTLQKEAVKINTAYKAHLHLKLKSLCSFFYEPSHLTLRDQREVLAVIFMLQRQRHTGLLDARLSFICGVIQRGLLRIRKTSAYCAKPQFIKRNVNSVRLMLSCVIKTSLDLSNTPSVQTFVLVCTNHT